MVLHPLCKPHFPHCLSLRGGTHTPLPIFGPIVPSLLGRSPTKTHPIYTCPLLIPNLFLPTALILVLGSFSILASQRLILVVQEQTPIEPSLRSGAIPKGSRVTCKVGARCGAERTVELSHVTGVLRMHTYMYPCTVSPQWLTHANLHLLGRQDTHSLYSKKPVPSPIFQDLNTWGTHLQTNTVPHSLRYVRTTVNTAHQALGEEHWVWAQRAWIRRDQSVCTAWLQLAVLPDGKLCPLSEPLIPQL